MAHETNGEENNAHEFSLDEYNKALDLFSLFSIQSPLPNELSDLNDGVAIFQVLSDYAPSYFDMCSIISDTNDNWIVKHGNIRCLLSNLELFFKECLNRKADIEACTRLMADTSQSSCVDGIISILEIFILAIIKINQSHVVEKIMSLDKVSIKVWMSLAERGSKRAIEIKSLQSQDDDHFPIKLDTSSTMSPISSYENAPSFLPPASPGCFSDDNDCSSILMERYGATHFFEGNNSMDIYSVIKERDELRQEMEKTKKDNVLLRSNIDSINIETEMDRRKFLSLLKDHEKQITSKDEELQSTSKQLSMVQDELEDAHHRIEELEQKHVQLMDEVDLADATSTQLQKAEMTLQIYKEKLEKAGDISQSMNELENRTEAYLLKNIKLENFCERIPKLEETVINFKNKLALAEKRNQKQDELYNEISNENELLRNKLSSTESKIFSYKQEAMELREQQRIGTEVENDINTLSDITLTSAASNMSREKILQLEFENSNLKEQLVQHSGHLTDENDDLLTVQVKYENLVQINRKLKREKDKLQYYTKAQVENFQHKYLSALHECKMKLSEKQDIISKQDQRMKEERDAHKREEKLISYAVYEMGSAMIQMQMTEKWQK